jgi:hypothetical protein
VQFDNLDGTYEFGLAAFDNAHVRQAVHFDALKLKFADSRRAAMRRDALEASHDSFACARRRYNLLNM